VTLGRVFKTFSGVTLAAAASPKASNLGPSRDGKKMKLDPIRDFFEGPHGRINMLKRAVMGSPTSTRLPIVATNSGDIKARRFLGTGSDTVVFEGYTADNTQVVIKYSIFDDFLVREAQMLRTLDKVKNVPKLLYENYSGDAPCIITSMVGKKVEAVTREEACKLIVDILEVLKELHGYGYIHNDIHPGNIVNVDGKFRLIDFGFAIPRSEARVTAPDDFPQGNIGFASHNRGKSLGAGDDLEALCYTVAFMCKRARSHWNAFQFRDAASLSKREKLSLFDGLPKVFHTFFEYAYDLDITSTPNYDYWRKQFQAAATDSLCPPKKRSREGQSVIPIKVQADKAESQRQLRNSLTPTTQLVD
jgi:serine/threonine protein kinase